jgi:hypothetical protein
MQQHNRFFRVNRKWILSFLFALSIFAAVFVVWGGPVGADTAPVSANGVAPELAPQALRTPGPFKSTGLGLKRGDWEKLNGQGTVKGRWMEYQSGKYRILFNNQNIWHLEINWTAKQALPLTQVRTLAKQMLPGDTQFVKTFTPMEEVVVDLFYSATLAKQYDPAAGWPGNRPGTFMVLYHIDDELPGGNRVTSAQLKVGSLPYSDNTEP